MPNAYDHALCQPEPGHYLSGISWISVRSTQVTQTCPKPIALSLAETQIVANPLIEKRALRKFSIEYMLRRIAYDTDSGHCRQHRAMRRGHCRAEGREEQECALTCWMSPDRQGAITANTTQFTRAQDPQIGAGQIVY